MALFQKRSFLLLDLDFLFAAGALSQNDRFTCLHCTDHTNADLSRCQAAEKLLSQGFAEGRFLVRRDGNLFAISLCADGSIVHEKVRALSSRFLSSCCWHDVPMADSFLCQVFFKDGNWLAACSPLRPHATLKALLVHHSTAAAGLPVALTRPCIRSRASRTKAGEGGAGSAVAAVGGGDSQVHAESHV
jgi:hypothetical protein